jgi:hypothetical protein
MRNKGFLSHCRAISAADIPCADIPHLQPDELRQFANLSPQRSAAGSDDIVLTAAKAMTVDKASGPPSSVVAARQQLLELIRGYANEEHVALECTSLFRRAPALKTTGFG